MKDENFSISKGFKEVRRKGCLPESGCWISGIGADNCYKALWRTGYPVTRVSSHIIKKYNLEQITEYTYKIDLYLPGQLMFKDLEVVQGDGFEWDHDVVIGMNVISQGVFKLDNLRGIFSFFVNV